MHGLISILAILAYLLSAQGMALADTHYQPIPDTGNNRISGTAGDDRLEGGDGNDVLLGGEGNDILAGGAGVDKLYGGLGADIFVISIDDIIDGNTDTIEDYNLSEGDEVQLDLPEYARKQRKLPDRLTIGNMRIGKRGRVSIRISDDDDMHIFNIRNSNIILKIDDDGNRARLKFKSRFQ